MGSNLITEELSRDIYILEDETNPMSSKINQIYPRTILDQVFDQISPSKKNLRQILAELKEEIVTGGLGNIIFPVTSVNNRQGDVIINKGAIGLANVDNTKDIDKPLSGPQRIEINQMISNYNFNVNLTELYNHLIDTNNPHEVTLNQINQNNLLTDLIETKITIHNTNMSTHYDIRRNLAKLWALTEQISTDVDTRINNILGIVNDHAIETDPHPAQFLLKEDKINKALIFDTANINHTKYPSTKAVSNFMNSSLVDFKATLPDVQNWIDSIATVETRTNLPPANASNWRKAFIIRKGNGSENEFAICKKNPDTTFSWDIFPMGSISKFHSDFFVDSINGLTLNISHLIDTILGTDGALNVSLSQILSEYYKSNYINENFLRSITIVPGDADGNIRYYINNDSSTMTDNIPVAGLKKYAFMDNLDENDIHPLSISNQHIQSHSINNRCLDGRMIKMDNIICKYGKVIGNTDNPNDDYAHEISLMQLADYLRPLIGGWPDPNVPGGTPWEATLETMVASPHMYTPGVEVPFTNHTYIMRFTGTISAVPNYMAKKTLSTTVKLGPNVMIGSGGSWIYQSAPKAVTVLGGSNITGHTFASINMDENGLYLESISIGDRLNAPYDIWVKYIKPDELENLSIPGYLVEFIPVQDIYNVTNHGNIGTFMPLSGNIIPSNATNKNIIWSLGTGSTAPGAQVANGKVVAENSGYVYVKATILNGINYTTNFEKVFPVYFN